MIASVHELLRAEGRHAVGGGKVPFVELAAIIFAAGVLYGAVMGAYGTRILQSCYSGLKVPLLLGVSTAVCLPSFYAVNSILGLRQDFAAAVRGVFAAQATLAVAILSLAPVTLFFYVSGEGYRAALVFNGAVFALGALGGQITLARHYRPLIRANPRHRIARNAWLGLYVFVAIQAAWVLRPYIGAPGLPTAFFREGAWSNAYVEVWNLVVGVVLRGG